MRKLIFAMMAICFLIWDVRSFAGFPSCNAGDTQVSVDVNGDVTCNNIGGWSYMIPSQTTLNAEAIAQVGAHNPVNTFNTDIFVQELAQTSLVTNPSLMQYYAVLKDMTLYKNFQGLANLISGLLQGGAINQSQVDIIDNTLENQQINLDSYNSEVNVAY